MYFCVGPPRTYGVPPSAVDVERERFEDVAVAMHPQLRVFARVTSLSVTLWSATVALQHPQYRKRHLATVPRSGSHVDAMRIAEHSVVREAPESDATGFVDSDTDTDPDAARRVFAVWVTDNKLAVVETGSQVVEFYAFAGLADVEATIQADGLDVASSVPSTPQSTAVASPATTSSSSSSSSAAAAVGSLAATLRGQFASEYPLNQGESDRDRSDTAAAMSGVHGSKFLFVGMASGLICVVEVAADNDATAGWFSEPQRTKLWKIDVLPHLSATPDATGDESDVAADTSDGTAESVAPACYALACASNDAPTGLTSLIVVACFEGGKCFIMLLAPATKRIEQLLSLVNTERDVSAAACVGRCTALALSATGERLALGWSDGGLSLFELATAVAPPTPSAAPTTGVPAAPTRVLTLQPIRELSLAPWGYAPEDVGRVSTIAWSRDARTVAVGFALRGFALFALDGCRLMSSLPQHAQPRPEPSGDNDSVTTLRKEPCADGVLQLLWTRESAALLVVPRGESFERLVSPPPSPSGRRRSASTDATTPDTIDVDDLYTRVTVELLKREDGLCLSLSGARGRCGAWVRSDNSFTRRARDGGIGPAEASGCIRGGDLLVAIDDDATVVDLPFERVVGAIKALATGRSVTLAFLRLDWDRVLPLAVQALTSPDFVAAHGLTLADDEDLSVREYALRMQVLHGDCDADARPPLLELERRAKFDGWAALQGVSRAAATHRYVKLLFAVFPTWHPLRTLEALAAFGNAVLALQHQQRRPASPKAKGQIKQTLRRRCAFAVVEFDFARSVGLAGGGAASRLLLLEFAAVRLVATPVADAPGALTSSARWRVPAAFEAKCAPLRLAAVSATSQFVAVAGVRGFCVLTAATGKWRLFGNVNDEQDVCVAALLWLSDDVVAAAFTRASEAHALLHVEAYPRDHLDADAVLARFAAPVGGTGATAASASSDAATDSVVCALALSADAQHVFCLTPRELWSFRVAVAGSVRRNDVRVELELRRTVALPSRLAGGRRLRNFAVLPRLAHVSPPTGTTTTATQQEVATEAPASSSSGWLASIVGFIAGSDAPAQFAPSDVLPRFAFLDDSGDVVAWDPEVRALRVVGRNVSTLAQLAVAPSDLASDAAMSDTATTWPTPCQLLFGLYGPDGMRLWLPLLDGVYLTHSRAFARDAHALETFIACHDPLRARTFAREFGADAVSPERYKQVLAEYGVALEQFDVVDDDVDAVEAGGDAVDAPAKPRVCVTSVDAPSATDRMLRFDADVSVLGVQPARGLLVGLSQDVYVPSGVRQPCYDVFARVQPFAHTLLCFLAAHRQVAWAASVVSALRRHGALAAPTHELFLHAMLESRFRAGDTRSAAAAFEAAIALLQPPAMAAALAAAGAATSEPTSHVSSDVSDVADADAVDEYCEIVAHVARKSEPTRLPLLFPACGDPVALLTLCRARNELRTAANFLLVLDASPSSAPSRVRRACANALVTQCIEHDEWDLAQHVVRVARDWEHPTTVSDVNPSDDRDRDVSDATSSIDAQLAAVVWTDFVHGAYTRVVRSVEVLAAKLPPSRARDVALANAEEEAIVAQRLTDVFVATNELRQLRILLQAVTEAQYDTWVRVIKRVMTAQ